MELGSTSQRAQAAVSNNGRMDKLVSQLRVPNTWFDPAMWARWEDDYLWPMPELGIAPSPDTAIRLARLVMAANRGKRSPRRYCRALGIAVYYDTLESASGGMYEAMIIPNVGHTFEIFCDSRADGETSTSIRFRLAHELAHTLFFNWREDIPRRTGPMDVTEERFCDAFGATLVGDPMPVREY